MKTFNESRRQFLTILTMLPAASFFAQTTHSLTRTGQPALRASLTGLPPLPYSYDALEPVIDAQTMRLHHDKHHAAYFENLSKALDKHPQLKTVPLEALLSDLSQVPDDIRTAVRNHGGGHFNHSLFWEIMRPGGPTEPSGDLAKALKDVFSSFDNFKAKFEEAGLKLFGSGWVWLVVTPAKKLEIMTTLNQDTPLSAGALPILGNDVWEHAYYLKYQNRRGEYLKAWWQVVNWDIVAKAFAAATS